MSPILVGVLALAAILATGPAFATTVTTSTGFLLTYAGPENGDVEISSASATIDGADLVLSATAILWIMHRPLGLRGSSVPIKTGND